MTKNCLELHDRGSIWKAIRSSVSLPGIFPPFFTDTGDMLVDGGITNNLPVDIMKKYMIGGRILAISCLSKKRNKLELSLDNLHFKGWTSGWKPLFNSFNPFSKSKPTNENIFKIILHSITLSSETHQRSIEKEADYLLKLDASEFSFLEFKSAKKLIEKGYSQAMEKLPLLLDMEKFSHPEV